MNKPSVQVLLVEDNPGDVGLIRNALDGNVRGRFDIEAVATAQTCRALLTERAFDVLLLDYSLPGENGLELLRSISDEAHPPVIMLTGQGDVLVAKEAIRSGAFDYVPKDSIGGKVLGDTIVAAIEAARRRADELRRQQDNQKAAITDNLTGLYNRRYLDEAADKECRRAARYGHPLSCLMLDLDGFKECNDRHGHLEGDSLLKQVSTVITHSVREIDIVARYGGDEFCVLLPETDLDGATQLAERLRFAVASLHFRTAALTASVGVFSSTNVHHKRPATLLAHADHALRRAKATGKNRVCVYSAPAA